LSFEFRKFILWVRQTAANPSAFWRYGFAVVAVLVATVVRLAFNPVVGVHAPHVLFGLGVIAAAWFGGSGPGLVATTLSALSGLWFFIEPPNSLSFAHPEAVWGLALFVFEGALIALLVGSLRESHRERARTVDTLRRQAHLIDLSHDGVITMDSHGRVITWNKGAEEMYGWSERDTIGKVFHQLLQTVGDTSIPEIDKVLHREGRWEGELSHMARYGHRLFVDSRQVLYGSGTRSSACILAISRDITARKEMEEDLRQSEEQFRTLADAIPQLCWMAKADGWIFWYNQRWYECTGTTIEEMRGWGWQKVHHPEHVARVVERIRHSFETGEPWEDTFPLRGKDGQYRWFLSRALPIRDTGGRIVRWFGTSTDISEQRRTEDALRNAHGELQAIMDVMPVAMLISRDPECRNVLGNPSAYQLFRELPGSNLAILPPEGEQPPAFWFIESGTDVPRHELPLAKAVAAGHAVCNRELELAFPDGSRANIIGNAVPLLDSRGRSTGAVGIFVDITERKQTEERLWQAQKLESIGLLAGGIAHDFNNLLTVILGNANLARTKYPSSAEIQDIITASERSAHLTSQLLAYAGKGQFISKTFSLTDAVSGSAELLSMSVPKRVELSFKLSPEELLTKGDPSQIEQILTNLVINAGEAMPPQADGRIEIATRTCEVTPEVVRAHAPTYDVGPGPFVCLEVSDNGCGMDEMTLAKIFDPFFSTKFTGRGLGLPAVQGIVRSCRGFIDAHSIPGAGSTFRVFLPASAEKPAAAITAGAMPRTSRRQDHRPATILVVDDEEMVRSMACMALRNQGHEVLEANNGKGALEVLAATATRPKLVLLDLTMPVMGGAELVPILNHDYPGLRVIVTSGYSEEDARRDLPPDAIADFLQKPYTLTTLMEKIEGALDSGGPNQEAPVAP
jgi:PAS domain S-box-containing protein